MKIYESEFLKKFNKCNNNFQVFSHNWFNVILKQQYLKKFKQ